MYLSFCHVLLIGVFKRAVRQESYAVDTAVRKFCKTLPAVMSNDAAVQGYKYEWEDA